MSKKAYNKTTHQQRVAMLEWLEQSGNAESIWHRRGTAPGFERMAAHISQQCRDCQSWDGRIAKCRYYNYMRSHQKVMMSLTVNPYLTRESIERGCPLYDRIHKHWLSLPNQSVFKKHSYLLPTPQSLSASASSSSVAGLRNRGASVVASSSSLPPLPPLRNLNNNNSNGNDDNDEYSDEFETDTALRFEDWCSDYNSSSGSKSDIENTDNNQNNEDNYSSLNSDLDEMYIENDFGGVPCLVMDKENGTISTSIVPQTPRKAPRQPIQTEIQLPRLNLTPCTPNPARSGNQNIDDGTELMTLAVQLTPYSNDSSPLKNKSPAPSIPVIPVAQETNESSVQLSPLRSPSARRKRQNNTVATVESSTEEPIVKRRRRKSLPAQIDKSKLQPEAQTVQHNSDRVDLEEQRLKMEYNLKERQMELEMAEREREREMKAKELKASEKMRFFMELVKEGRPVEEISQLWKTFNDIQ